MRKNVNLKCVSPIYRLLCEGRRNEDRRYALLFLALEINSQIRSSATYCCGDRLLCSSGKNDVSPSSSNTPLDNSSNQVGSVRDIDVELNSIRVDGLYTSVDNVDPVAQTLVSEPKSDAKVDLVGPTPVFEPKTDSEGDPVNAMVVSEPTSGAEVDPVNPTVVSEPASGAEVEPVGPTLISEPANGVEVEPVGPTLISEPASGVEVDPLDPTLISEPASGAEVDQVDPTVVSEPASGAEVDHVDPTVVSEPASGAEVDPVGPTVVSEPTSSANVPRANILHRRRYEQPPLQELVYKVDLPNHNGWNKAMDAISLISGVRSASVDTQKQELTLTTTIGVDLARINEKLSLFWTSKKYD